MVKKVEISHRTVVFTVFFIILLMFLFRIRDILIQIFVSLVIMTILNPTVTKLHKRKVPRALSVLIVYITFISFLVVLVIGITPLLIDQTTNFAASIPVYIDGLGLPSAVSEQIGKEIAGEIAGLPAQILRISVAVFSNVFSVFYVLILAFYLLVAREKLDAQLGSFFGDERKKQIAKVVDEIEIKLGGWARAEIFLMTLVGLFSYLGLMLLGVPYALPLALLAGILEIVPNIGPILAAVPAVIVGFGVSPVTGLATIALTFVIQQVENYVFVPKVMEKSAGVNPMMTLVALAIGFKIAGIVGAILSIPVVLTGQIFVRQYISFQKHE